MADLILLTSPPGSSRKGPAGLPEAGDYELPVGYDPAPRLPPHVSLEDAESHFRPWIDAFAANWERDQSRGTRKLFAPFVIP